MEKGIIFAGNLIVDYVKVIDSYPKPGMLTNIRAISRCIGGCAGNTSVDLARMDKAIPIKCAGMVGDDENGQYILSVLADNGIDVSKVVVNPAIETSFTDVMSVAGSGERTFFHARGANQAFTYDHLDFEKLEADMFHIGYALLLDAFDSCDPEYGTVMAKTLARAKEKGMVTSMDVVSENSDRFKRVVEPSLKYCDYIIINEVEAALISGIDIRDSVGIICTSHIRGICEALFAMGVREKVVIHAPEGGWIMDNNGKITFAASLRLPDGYIKGSVGAGDAFCAGILYSIYKGFSTEKALKIAAAAAGANLSHENSIDGMKTLEGLMKLDKQFRV